MKNIFTERGFVSFELMMIAFGAIALMTMIAKILSNVSGHESSVITAEAELRSRVSGINTPCLETVASEQFKICN